MNEHVIKPIARIKSDFSQKFGIPRQAGIVEELEALVIFEKDYADESALRGIEGFSHLWIIWQFSENLREGWSPTVRPPRLGGNERLGVFATRSPFRPNALGLSCVRLLGLVKLPGQGTALRIAGADMLDGTPVYDIKPYVAYADAHPEAISGFAADAPEKVAVKYAPGTEEKIDPEMRAALEGVLAADPRPRYHQDAQRVYTMDFAGLSVSFRVEDGAAIVEKVDKM